jgi:hypothetical protein
MNMWSRSDDVIESKTKARCPREDAFSRRATSLPDVIQLIHLEVPPRSMLRRDGRLAGIHLTGGILVRCEFSRFLQAHENPPLPQRGDPGLRRRSPIRSSSPLLTLPRTHRNSRRRSRSAQAATTPCTSPPPPKATTPSSRPLHRPSLCRRTHSSAPSRSCCPLLRLPRPNTLLLHDASRPQTMSSLASQSTTASQ